MTLHHLADNRQQRCAFVSRQVGSTISKHFESGWATKLLDRLHVLDGCCQVTLAQQEIDGVTVRINIVRVRGCPDFQGLARDIIIFQVQREPGCARGNTRVTSLSRGIQVFLQRHIVARAVTGNFSHQQLVERIALERRNRIVLGLKNFWLWRNRFRLSHHRLSSWHFSIGVWFDSRTTAEGEQQHCSQPSALAEDLCVFDFSQVSFAL